MMKKGSAIGRSPSAIRDHLFYPEMFAELRSADGSERNDKDIKVVSFDSADPKINDIVRGEVVPDMSASPFSEWPAFRHAFGQSR